MSDDLSKKVLGQIFSEKRKGVAERRQPGSPGAPMRAPGRRHPTAKSSLFAQKGEAKPTTKPLTYTHREGDRRVSTTKPSVERRAGMERRASGIQAERDLRVAATSGAATAERGTIVSAPIQRRVASRAAGTIGSSTSILKKLPGRLGKLATAGLAAYGAYRAWKDE